MVHISIKDEEKIRLLIAEKGDSLRSFSTEIKMSHSYLSQILSNQRNPSPRIAYKIADNLNVNIKDIFLIKTVTNDKQINVN